MTRFSCTTVTEVETTTTTKVKMGMVVVITTFSSTSKNWELSRKSCEDTTLYTVALVTGWTDFFTSIFRPYQHIKVLLHNGLTHPAPAFCIPYEVLHDVM